jgi:hypothetical protein
MVARTLTRFSLIAFMLFLVSACGGADDDQDGAATADSTATTVATSSWRSERARRNEQQFQWHTS